MYYLQSRYYDPSLKRFINADVYCDTGTGLLGTNMFAYCENNAVNASDPEGCLSIAKVAIKLAAFTSAVAYTTIRLSIAMYLYAITGSHFNSNLDFSAWYSPIGILLRNRLNNSKLISNYIKDCIKSNKMSSKKLFNFSQKGGNVADFDLSMSVGHANLSFAITKTDKKQFIWWGKKKYIVKIKISDIYDFTLFTKKDASFIKCSINNYLGYYPQEWKILKPYNWTMTYSMDYYY